MHHTPHHRLQMSAIVALVGLLCNSASAQSNGNSNAASGEIDACGTLVQVGRCVLFSGGGGNYVIVEAGDFKVGDAVRVVGTINPNCSNICTEADGCIAGATLYNPAVLPCGTPIPDLSTDLGAAALDSLCTAASGAIGGLALLGMCLHWPRRLRS